jgi:hypothetical protein
MAQSWQGPTSHRKQREVDVNRKMKILTGASILAVVLAALLASTVYAQGPNPRGGRGRGGMGMMGGWGYGMGPTTGTPFAGPGGPSGCPGMGAFGWGYTGADALLTMDQATEAAQRYVTAYGDPDLVLAELMEFSLNFYAEVEEKSTGLHAFEILINRYTGAVTPEMGPNMMWNKADTFYGYYTIHVLRDGQVYGMLSVNGTTGQVWYHTWHGDFIAMREFHEEE